MSLSLICHCQLNGAGPAASAWKSGPGTSVTAEVAVEGPQAPAACTLLSLKSSASREDSAGWTSPRASLGSSGASGAPSSGMDILLGRPSNPLPTKPSPAAGAFSPRDSPFWTLQNNIASHADARTFSADTRLPLIGLPLRTGEVWHIRPDPGKRIEQTELSLFANGFSIRPMSPGVGKVITVTWSPFTLVQACRLHSPQADEGAPAMRLFKLTLLHCGSTYFFVVPGDQAELDRVRWVAEVSRALRMLTQSLFPEFSLSTQPLLEASWTNMRLLAGYMLLLEIRTWC